MHDNGIKRNKSRTIWNIFQHFDKSKARQMRFLVTSLFTKYTRYKPETVEQNRINLEQLGITYKYSNFKNRFYFPQLFL